MKLLIAIAGITAITHSFSAPGPLVAAESTYKQKGNAMKFREKMQEQNTMAQYQQPDKPFVYQEALKHPAQPSNVIT